VSEKPTRHRRRFLGATAASHGHGGAAALLGVKPTTLASRMKVLGITRAHWENATRGDPSVLRWPYAMSIERPCMWDVMLVASVWSQAGEEYATQRGGGNAMQHDTGGGCHASSAPSTLWRAPQSVYDEATSSPLMSERRRKRVRK
jgi:hypothetical protein